jgi:hypothetical protein
VKNKNYERGQWLKAKNHDIIDVDTSFIKIIISFDKAFKYGVGAKF